MRLRVGGAFVISAAMLAAGLSGCAEKSSTGNAAESYPEKSIKYIIPFDPGGESDVTARLQQDALEDAFGQSVVVSNREGGGGAVGWSELASRTKGDGYTLMGANLPHIVLQPLARDDAGYQTEDIKWAYIFESTPAALIVAKDSPYKTLKDFVKAAKQKKLTIGGSASFSSNHMGTLALNRAAGIDATYVPFSGTAAVTPALLGGQVDAIMSYNTAALDLKEKGARILAVGSDERLDAFPDVPTFAEQGYDINQGGAYRGVAVPPDTPKPIVDKVADVFRKVNENPKVKKKMDNLGFELVNMGPEKAKKFTQKRKASARDLLKKFDLLKK